MCRSRSVMAARKVSGQASGRRATPASFSTEKQRYEELAMEARALLARHRSETFELERRIVIETAALCGVTLRPAA